MVVAVQIAWAVDTMDIDAEDYKRFYYWHRATKQ